MNLADGSGLSFWSTLSTVVASPTKHAGLIESICKGEILRWTSFNPFDYIIYRTLGAFVYFLNDNFVLGQLILITFTPSFKTLKMISAAILGNQVCGGSIMTDWLMAGYRN